MKKKTPKSEYCRKADKDRAPLHPSKTTYLCSEVPLLQQSLSFIPAGPGLAGNQNYALHLLLLCGGLRPGRLLTTLYPNRSVPGALPGGSPPPSPCFESHPGAPRNLRGLWRSHWHLPPSKQGFVPCVPRPRSASMRILAGIFFYANKPLLAVTSQGCGG